MRATVFIEVSFELSEPDYYPESVRSWEDAALNDAEGFQVRSELDLIVSAPARVVIDGNDPFERTEGDNFAGDGAEG